MVEQPEKKLQFLINHTRLPLRRAPVRDILSDDDVRIPIWPAPQKSSRSDRSGQMSSRPLSLDEAAADNRDSVNGPRSHLPYLFLLLLYAASRAAYYALGVRFDMRPLSRFFQIIDPELLKHRLIESLCYLHTQPPGFNLYTGVMLKLFPDHYATAFHVLYVILGGAVCCLLYHLMRVCGVHAVIAFALAAWFIVSPAVVLFENFFLYEFLLVFLLLGSAAALHHFFQTGRTVYAAAFFLCLFSLLLIRNHFH